MGARCLEVTSVAGRFGSCNSAVPNVLTKMHRDVVEACLVVPSQIPTDLTVKPSALTVMMVTPVGEWYGGEKGLGGRQH